MGVEELLSVVYRWGGSWSLSAPQASVNPKLPHRTRTDPRFVPYKRAMVPPPSGVIDREQLLHTAQAEAKELELAISTAYSKFFEDSHHDDTYNLLHEEHTRLCKLRRMKEIQITLLLKSILNEPQQQASFQTTPGPPKKRRWGDDHNSPLPSPDKPGSDINKEAVPPAQNPRMIDLINPPFKAPAKSNAVDTPEERLPYWQRPQLGVGFD